MKVAIQGIKGSFHDIAALQYFCDQPIELICCDTFEDLFVTMRNDESCLGVMAIENTIAGSLLHNYELLQQSKTKIVGEHKLHIEHSLLAMPGQQPSDIREIHSHPVALMQCREFLRTYPWAKAVEMPDTAGSARLIAEQQMMGHGAICHADAAELYGLEVVERAIEDNKHNFTRFLILADTWRADQMAQHDQSDKASIVFALPHEEGSLSQVLSIFSFYKINLTKIQSLPIIGREWQYLFYVDVSYDNYLRYRQSIDAVRPLTKDLRILGEYMAFQ